MPLRVTEVFTPNDFPVHSYVKRTSDDLEGDLTAALETPKTVISVSGPSKAGKTVLIEKIVGVDLLITVSGAQIGKASDLWERVLDWIGVPETVTSTSSLTTSGQISASGEGGLSLPLVASGKLTGGIQAGLSRAGGENAERRRGGLEQVVKEIGGSEFVVFVDDFHYIPKDVQTDVAKQVKAAAGMGVRLCLAAVPHRADDAVRSNSELRGRTAAINVPFWTQEELSLIAAQGFEALGYICTKEDALRFAHESCSSPQLMQQICLQACFAQNIRVARSGDASLNLSPLAFPEALIKDVLAKSALQTDYTSLVRDLHAGPKTRGTERKVFDFKDGSRGDVYRAILLALSYDPPQADIAYADFVKRIEGICEGETPGMGSVIGSARQMSAMAREAHPDERIVEWEDNAAGGILSIVDPYLLFYLRSSTKLAELGGV